jgi:Ni/Co efflux regulator RcnB
MWLAMFCHRVADVHGAKDAAAMRKRWLRWVLQVVLHDADVQQLGEVWQFVAAWKPCRASQREPLGLVGSARGVQVGNQTSAQPAGQARVLSLDANIRTESVGVAMERPHFAQLPRGEAMVQAQAVWRCRNYEVLDWYLHLLGDGLRGSRWVRERRRWRKGVAGVSPCLMLRRFLFSRRLRLQAVCGPELSGVKIFFIAVHSHWGRRRSSQFCVVRGPTKLLDVGAQNETVEISALSI